MFSDISTSRVTKKNPGSPCFRPNNEVLTSGTDASRHTAEGGKVELCRFNFKTTLQCFITALVSVPKQFLLKRADTHSFLGIFIITESYLTTFVSKAFWFKEIWDWPPWAIPNNPGTSKVRWWVRILNTFLSLLKHI